MHACFCGISGRDILIKSLQAKVDSGSSWPYDLYLWRFDLKVPDWYQLPKAQVQVLRSEVQVQVPIIPDQVQPKYSSMDSGW